MDTGFLLPTNCWRSCYFVAHIWCLYSKPGRLWIHDYFYTLYFYFNNFQWLDALQAHFIGFTYHILWDEILLQFTYLSDSTLESMLWYRLFFIWIFTLGFTFFFNFHASREIFHYLFFRFSFAYCVFLFSMERASMNKMLSLCGIMLD